MLGQNWKVLAKRFSNGDANLVGVGDGDGVSGSFGAGVSQFDGGELFEIFCKRYHHFICLICVQSILTYPIEIC